MKTRMVLMYCLLMGAIFISWMQMWEQFEKIESYETELIRATDEIRELEEENANWRKQIESMQMYIDMNINPQFYTVDVESDEKMGEVK